MCPFFLTLPGQAGVSLLEEVVVCEGFRDEGVAPTGGQAGFGARGAPFWTGCPMHAHGAGRGLLREHDLGLAQHGVQQHVAACFDVLGLGVFDFVVADAVFAGNKNHASGR